MKNLIDEIEKLKNRGGWTNDEFYRCGINDCLNLLNQYNIITAPKSIKLSEIINRLSEITGLELSVEDGLWCHKAIGHYIKCWEDYDFDELVGFNKNMKITHISVGCKDNIKWLYTLWIAGTTIEDDLKECDE